MRSGAIAADRDRGRWFVPFEPQPRADMRLFCFHYAGGNAGIFRDWAASLPKGVELLAVQLPGHGARYAEPLISDLETLIAFVHAEMQPLTTKPYYLFGHSMGALLAYEVGLRLQYTGHAPPRHVIVSGALPPHIPRESVGTAGVSDAETVRHLGSYQGTRGGVLGRSELVR